MGRVPCRHGNGLGRAVTASVQAAPARAADVRLALRLTWLTLAWMLVEGCAALWLGLKSQSLLLDGFGLDSGLEMASAGVLLWRLSAEASGLHSEARVEAAEHRAARLVGLGLYALASGIVAGAGYGLLVHHTTDARESMWGIALGIMAKAGMPILAGAKLRVAARLNSRALRADAMEAITCGYLSVVLIAGLAATRLFGWWWLDSAASLVLVPFLVKEGREAIAGECGCGNNANASECVSH